MPDARLIIGSTAYGGWKSLAIERGIEQLAGTFEFKVSAWATDGSAAKDIKNGAKAAVSIDGTTVISGFVDAKDLSHSAEEHTISITGRDAAADLVDASALHKTGQWSDQGMLAIARDLTQPFGISVSSDTDLGKPFTKWNIEPGETVFENLDRMARHRGVLVVSDGSGGVLLTRAGQGRAPTKLVLGENILSGHVTHSNLDRFSEYIVLGQRPSDDDSLAEQITELSGRAKDAAITRYRPSIEIVEDVADTETLRKRALWRRNVQAARGIRATINVQGWTHEKGLWTPNTRVTVTDERLELDETELLIVKVRHALDENGTLTQLTLTIPEALTPEELPEKEDGA